MLYFKIVFVVYYVFLSVLDSNGGIRSEVDFTDKSISRVLYIYTSERPIPENRYRYIGEKTDTWKTDTDT